MAHAIAAPVSFDTSVTLKRIMFATDFSSASLAALPFAAAIARTFNSDLHLFHLLIGKDESCVPNGHAFGAATRRIRDLARSPLMAAVKIASEEIVQGEFSALQKHVEQKDIDLLVIGTHGRRGFERLMLGSFAEAVIRTASCPVLTVGPRTKHLTSLEFLPRQVLFATDASPDSFCTLHDAILFAHGRGEFTIIHVLPDGHEDSPEAIAFATLMRDSLHRTLSLETIKRCNPEILVKSGNPVDCILAAANERGSELIVMGARSAEIKRGRNGKGGVLYGVIARSSCPVLTVRGHAF
jgi:nucleotide-binding universal stress UspA family protein